MSSQLTDLMREASEDLLLAPGFTDAVVRGGRRRRARRRVAAGGVASVGVLGLALIATTGDLGKRLSSDVSSTHPRPSSSPVSRTQGGPLSDGGTHGDLAGDATYLDAVRLAWTTWMADQTGVYEHPSGPAQILWAGTTPAGPAALLQQDVDIERRTASVDPGSYASLGFIGVGTHGPRVDWTHFGEDSRTSTAWYVDTTRRTLVITDNEVARGVSFGWDYQPDGRRTRTFTPVRFKDGAAVVTLPAGVRRDTVAISDLPRTSPADNVQIANVDLQQDEINSLNGLDWPSSNGVTDVPFGSERLDHDQLAHAYFDLAKRVFDVTDRSEMYGGPGKAEFLVHGITANGSKVRITQDQLDSDPAHLYLSYGEQLTHLGVADPSAVLPVRAKLPEDQGWVVAALHAELRYRVGNAPWQAAGHGAALLPANATSVEVTPAGGQPQVVQLS